MNDRQYLIATGCDQDCGVDYGQRRAESTAHRSFANDFHQSALAPATVKFPIENLLPRTEIKPPFGDGDYNLAPHDLAFQMRVSVVLTGAVVQVLGNRSMRREFFEPGFIVLKEAAFRVVDENRGRYVHGVDQAQPFLHAALADEPFHRVSDVDETAAIGDLKPEMFGERFHGANHGRIQIGANRKPSGFPLRRASLML